MVNSRVRRDSETQRGVAVSFSVGQSFLRTPTADAGLLSLVEAAHRTRSLPVSNAKKYTVPLWISVTTPATSRYDNRDEAREQLIFKESPASE